MVLDFLLQEKVLLVQGTDSTGRGRITSALSRYRVSMIRAVFEQVRAFPFWLSSAVILFHCRRLHPAVLSRHNDLMMYHT